MLNSSSDAAAITSFAKEGQASQPPLFEHSDLTLARAILARDRKATAEFVQMYSGPVFGYVHSRLAPRAELIEDIVQDVFMVAWQRLGSYRGESTLQNWLLGIARHKVEDHFRERFRMFEELDAEMDVPNATLVTLDDQLDLERRAEAAWRVLYELPERYRMILLWRYWEARSAREIAGSIGGTEKAVERLLARAREQFRKRWSHV